jgi:hypothetical protein
MSETTTLEKCVPGERQEKHEPRILLVPFDEIQFNRQPRDLVRGLIPREGPKPTPAQALRPSGFPILSSCRHGLTE